MNGLAARLNDAARHAVQGARLASEEAKTRRAALGGQRVAGSNHIWSLGGVGTRHVFARKGAIGLFLRRISDAIGQDGREGVGLARILEASGSDLGRRIEPVARRWRRNQGGGRRRLATAQKSGDARRRRQI